MRPRHDEPRHWPGAPCAPSGIISWTVVDPTQNTPMITLVRRPEDLATQRSHSNSKIHLQPTHAFAAGGRHFILRKVYIAPLSLSPRVFFKKNLTPKPDVLHSELETVLFTPQDQNHPGFCHNREFFFLFSPPTFIEKNS